jgi:16S rRNA U516 pseudouridylate synthase RsuA-like enzyme
MFRNARLGELIREGQQEPESILKIQEPALGNKPLPIEVVKRGENPRQTFDQAWFEIVMRKGTRHQLRRVHEPPGLGKVSEARVPKAGERRG